MKTFKGFDKNLKCANGFQYEIGHVYELKEKPICCKKGFHSCENPLDLFNYYPPADSRYCETEATGDIDKKAEGDSKLASSKIKIGLELNLKSLIEAGIKFVFEKCEWTNKNQTGDRGASQQTGDRGASQQTGYRGASQQTGDQGASQQTGDRGASQQTGNYGASQQTGNYGASLTTGIGATSRIINSEKITCIGGAAIALGPNSKVAAPINNWLVCAEWENKKGKWKQTSIKSAKVDGKKIKADTWYKLEKGKFVVAK